jgi:polyphosphate glucokinase
MNVLAVDVGGTHVKFLATSPISSGPALTAKRMVTRVVRATQDWTYDVVSIGYPGLVLQGRPIAEPHNLGRGWAGFNFDRAFRRRVKVINDAAMQALGCYQRLRRGTWLANARSKEMVALCPRCTRPPCRRP